MTRQLISRALIFLLTVAALSACGNRGGNGGGDRFTMVLEAAPRTLDPLRGFDASSERFRQLMFNSLVKKNERFEYVGDLASDIQRAPDGLSYTFKLRDGVKFHDGRTLSSADVKDTFVQLLTSDSPKAPPFFQGTGANRKPFIAGIETPDPQTVVFRLNEPWLELPANLVPIAIIPQGTFATQERQPLGTGPFKFARFDEAQGVVDMQAFADYWEGAPNIKNLRVRVILDANTQQAELKSGRVDLAVNTALLPDTYVALQSDPNLKVVQAPGVNVQYLGFNTQSPPLNDARVRQAIASAIDRESVVKNLLQGQARLAHSILPQESWAYAPGITYNYDPARAKQLLDEAGLRDPDGDGPALRLEKPLVFKVSASNNVVRQFAGVIQNSLKDVGIPVSIETLEDNTLRDAQRSGQYQLTTGRWVGGNQDPIFLRDLFTFLTGGNFNRSRYSNSELDQLLGEAVRTPDQTQAKQLYARAQEIISREMPMLPLWYHNNMIVARQNINHIQIEPGGDWRFVRLLTVDQ